MSCFACKIPFDRDVDNALDCTFCDSEAHFHCVDAEDLDAFLQEDLYACPACCDLYAKLSDAPTKAGKRFNNVPSLLLY
jgi:hypothetical protein